MDIIGSALMDTNGCHKVGYIARIPTGLNAAMHILHIYRCQFSELMFFKQKETK